MLGDCTEVAKCQLEMRKIPISFWDVPLSVAKELGAGHVVVPTTQVERVNENRKFAIGCGNLIHSLVFVSGFDRGQGRSLKMRYLSCRMAKSRNGEILSRPMHLRIRSNM